MAVLFQRFGLWWDSGCYYCFIRKNLPVCAVWMWYLSCSAPCIVSVFQFRTHCTIIEYVIISRVRDIFFHLCAAYLCRCIRQKYVCRKKIIVREMATFFSNMNTISNKSLRIVETERSRHASEKNPNRAGKPGRTKRRSEKRKKRLFTYFMFRHICLHDECKLLQRIHTVHVQRAGSCATNKRTRNKNRRSYSQMHFK